MAFHMIFRSAKFIREAKLFFKSKLPVTILSASICSKHLRDPSIQKPAPWPYETKKFTYWHWWFEGTKKRFDENTKVIVVDGNIGAGKTSFAKQLADEFDMKYIPEPSMDRYYITPYGYDLRQLDPVVPPSFKSCDVKKFYENPHSQTVTLFQFRMYTLRYLDYIDAVAHVLNTGQGVVMDRSVFSDLVFMEAMHEAGYIKRNARDHYMNIYNNCTKHIKRPHLVIYLDITVDKALERIKQRNDPSEVNSKVLTEQYLGSIEYHYKQQVLKRLGKHAEILIYDWNNYGDTEVVVEDIERIDFDRFGKYEEKMKDWRSEDDWKWGLWRYRYTNDLNHFLQYVRVPQYKVKELYHPGEETIEYRKILDKVPGEKYDPEFNPSMGDKVLFKTDYSTYRKRILHRVDTYR